MPKYLIVGGVAGGMSAAARLRRLDEKSEIIVFEKGEYISYANCGLPYYIGNTIKEREKLLVQTPENFNSIFNVDIRTRNEVIGIDRANKTIRVRNLITGTEYAESYDKLLLSPGASPIRPPIPGIDHKYIFTLRSIPDTDRIKNFIEQTKPKRALIVGAGFIGLEMAENLHNLGIFVTIVEMANQVMNVIDYEMAAEVHQHLKTKNVEFYLDDAVSSFTSISDKIKVHLKSGRELDVDMVILSIGIKPDSEIAKNAGLELGVRGAIAVNEYLQTSDPDIYAAGDAIQVLNPILGQNTLVPLGGPANKQGRIAADNIASGNKKVYKGTIGTAIAKVFDLTVGVTGATEKMLRQAKIPYIASTIHPSSHAGYYPNALPMTLKIVFAPVSGKLLGAQAVGYEGVDKRLDVLSLAVEKQHTVYDLSEFEHAYAPPYSSGKDPLNIAGYVAENILANKVKVMQWHETLNVDKNSVLFLDVRPAEIFNIGHIDNAVNIPINELRQRLRELPKDKKIVAYCAVGLRAYVACRMLIQNGFEEVYNLSGGYKTYETVTQKQDNGDIFEGYSIGLDDLLQDKTKNETKSNAQTIDVDACGLQCPGPIMKLKAEIEKAGYGDKLLIKATDSGFYKDIGSWAKVTGNKLLSLEYDKGVVNALIEKSEKVDNLSSNNNSGNALTLILFNDDMDKALASFVIANGALAMGKKVTIFFTFWGLNVIKKNHKIAGLGKTFIEKMFGFMMPHGSEKLKLSQMHMMGMGTKMIRWLMKKKNIDSLEQMIRSAIDGGAELTACQMSMDLMGVKKEELLDGVGIGGVATYLDAAGDANNNLFI